MSLLNLSLPEFIAIFGTLSAVLVTLYLLDRSRRKVVASTLRFWKPAGIPPQQKQKRRIQQPWSLLLQIISVALLLLAIAQMQWGTRNAGRDHVLILDTSAWMNARTPNGTLMDEARRSALAYVRSLPPSDRVLVVRADGLATPAGVLESHRRTLERTIRESAPGPSALNLQQAFDFAREVMRLQARRPGEVVFAGSGRIGSGESTPAPPPNVRVLAVNSSVENVGLRRVGLKRSETEAGAWQVYVAARNYGAATRTVPLELRFGGALIGMRALTLKPNSDQEETFTLRTRAAGMLEARLVVTDALPEDDRASIEIPEQRTLKIVAFTAEPESLRPVLTSNPHVTAEFRSPAAYAANVEADAVILDGFAPPQPPKLPAIWINPPERGSPVPIRSHVEKARLRTWNSEHELGEGLRSGDTELESATVFAPREGDVVVARVDAGPVIVARESRDDAPRTVVFGFHPMQSALRYELAAPLVFANVLRWMHPDLFRRWELNAGTAGPVTARMDNDFDVSKLVVRSDAGTPVPYTADGDQVRFFAGAPGNIRLLYGDREIVYSLTLPHVGETAWTIPAGVKRGVPRRNTSERLPTDLWPWLALLGGLGLAAEWVLYGRGQRRIRSARARASQPAWQRWVRRKAS